MPTEDNLQHMAAAAMKRHKLGNSDLEVPIVCLGTMTFGVQNDEASSFAIMDRALELGIDFFDTAELVGAGPIMLGGLGRQIDKPFCDECPGQSPP